MTALAKVVCYLSVVLPLQGSAAAHAIDEAAQPAQPTPAAPTPVVLLPEKNLCADRAEPVALGSVQWNGWGRDADNTRYQPEPAIRAMDVSKLGLKWAFGYQGEGNAGQPTAVDGRLFVASSAGRVYALDAKSGCIFWTYDLPAGASTAISIGELGQAKRAAVQKRLRRTLAHLDVIKAPSAAFLGDDSGTIYALDAQKGTLLWKTRVDPHPLARIVGAPTLKGDRLYVAVGSNEEKMAAAAGYSCCTFRGSVVALDIAGGRIVWKSYTVLEEPQAIGTNSAGVQEFAPAGAAISSPPTIDTKRGVVYVSTGDSTTGVRQSLTNAVVAFDLNDGKLRWVKQLEIAGEAGSSGFTSPPVLRTLGSGNQIILAGQLSGMVYGLDPDHGGEILWRVLAGGEGGGGVAWGLAADYRNLYVAKSGLLAPSSNAAGSLTALDLKTGLLRWNMAAPAVACSWGEENCWHAQSQAVTVMPGSAFSGSKDGHLRAYSTIDGKILWDFDTAKTFQTQNGVHASGGPLDRGGATIVNGNVYINSGNTLLAFSVGGK